MSCDLCDRPLIIGEIYDMTGGPYPCSICASPNTPVNKSAQYRGLYNGNHEFRTLKTTKCPGCGTNLTVIQISCGNSKDLLEISRLFSLKDTAEK